MYRGSTRYAYNYATYSDLDLHEYEKKEYRKNKLLVSRKKPSAPPLKDLDSEIEGVDDDCSICLDSMLAGTLVKCKNQHIFHEICITKCISKTCPLCRVKL